jgi:hypothetical protein
MSAASAPDGSRAEAERQLVAAIERHREVTASVQQLGRSEAGQHVAVKAVGRAVHLVSFALKRAAGAGVAYERLVELTAWDPDLVHEGLERPVLEPRSVAKLAPAGTDPHAIARAAAAFEVLRRLQELTERVLADVDGAEDAPVAAHPSELDDMHAQLEAAWHAWRHDLGDDAA